VELRDAGVGAVVLPSLFQEQLEFEAFKFGCVSPPLPAGASMPGWFSDVDTYNSGAERYLNLVERAAAADLGIPVIASINGGSSTTLIRYARQLDEAGADAIELNLYQPVTGNRRPAAEIEDGYVDLVGAVRNAIDVPLAVKIGPWFTALAHVARRLVVAGADGLVLFNRFYQPDIDVDTLEIVPGITLSSSDDLRLPLSWIALLSGSLPASLAASSGVHTAADAVKVLLAGGDVAMMTSALLEHGVARVREVVDGVSAWLTSHDYLSVDQIRGLLSVAPAPDGDVAEHERFDYVHTLTSYPTPS